MLSNIQSGVLPPHSKAIALQITEARSARWRRGRSAWPAFSSLQVVGSTGTGPVAAGPTQIVHGQLDAARLPPRLFPHQPEDLLCFRRDDGCSSIKTARASGSA